MTVIYKVFPSSSFLSLITDFIYFIVLGINTKIAVTVYASHKCAGDNNLNNIYAKIGNVLFTIKVNVAVNFESPFVTKYNLNIELIPLSIKNIT